MIENFDFSEAALEIGKMLKEFKGEDTVVLDLREANIWTDFFIICTVSSATHASGLQKRIYEVLPKYDLEEFKTKRKVPDGDDWKLIDLGGIVIHLMNEKARKFYSLEKIWYDSKNIL